MKSVRNLENKDYKIKELIEGEDLPIEKIVIREKQYNERERNESVSEIWKCLYKWETVWTIIPTEEVQQWKKIQLTDLSTSYENINYLITIEQITGTTS